MNHFAYKQYGGKMNNFSIKIATLISIISLLVNPFFISSTYGVNYPNLSEVFSNQDCNWTSKYGNSILKGNALACGPMDGNLFNTWIYDKISNQEKSYPVQNYTLNYQGNIYFCDKGSKELVCIDSNGQFLWKSKTDITSLLAIDNGFLIGTWSNGLLVSFFDINTRTVSRTIDFAKNISSYSISDIFLPYYNSSFFYLSTNDAIYCFDQYGNPVWTNKDINSKTSGTNFTFVSKIDDNLIGATNINMEIICVSISSGSIKWNAKFDNNDLPIRDCFAYGSSVYINKGGWVNPNTISKLNLYTGVLENSFLLAEKNNSHSVNGSISITSTGAILTYDCQNNIYSLDSNLNLMWKLPPKEDHKIEKGFKLKSIACNNKNFFFTGYYGEGYKNDFGLVTAEDPNTSFDGHLFVGELATGKTLQENVIGLSIGNISIGQNSITAFTSKGVACFADVKPELFEQIIEINVKPTMSKVNLKDDKGNIITYDRIELPGYYNFGEPGSPKLPVISKMLSLGSQYNLVNCEAIVVGTEPIRGNYIIEPAQIPEKAGTKNPPEWFRFSKSVYSADSPTTEPVEQISQAKSDQEKFISITINPISYIPSSGSLSIHNRFKIRYSLTKNTPRLFSNSNTINSKNGYFDKIDMVIFSTNSLIGQPDSYMNDFADYASWKTSTGFKTICIPLESLENDGDTFTSLENKIRNMILQYHEFNSTKYFIMGGTSKIVPNKQFVFDSRYCDIAKRMDPYSFFTTDQFYSCLDDDWTNQKHHVWRKEQKRDWLPDVRVGRVPCSDTTELSNYLQKAVVHQMRSKNDAGMDKVFLTAKTLWVENDSRDFYNHIETRYINPTNIFKAIKYYEQDQEYDQNKFADIINTNYPSIVATRSHGCPSSSVVDLSIVDKLRNKGKYFFCQALTPCTTNPIGPNNKFDDNDVDDYLGKKFVLSKDNGAYGYVGNSHYGWEYYCDIVEDAFFSGVFEKKITRIGDTVNFVKESLITGLTSSFNDYEVWVFYTGNLLGDPSIDLFDNNIISPPPEQSNWEMWGRTPDQNRVAALGAGPQTSNLAKKWEYTLSGESEQLCSSVSIYNGKSYFVTNTRIICLDNATGLVVWEYNVGSKAYSPPCVINGFVFAGFENNKVISLDANTGRLLWSFNANGGVLRTPVFMDNSIFFGSADQYYYCLDAFTGYKKWSFFADGEINSHSCVVNEKVYFTSSNKKIHCIDQRDGSLIWQNDIPDVVKTTVVYSHNMIYFGCEDSKLHCYNANNGSEVWSYPLDKPVQSSPAIYYNRIYFGCENGKFTCLDTRTGSFVWEFQTSGRIYSSPAIADNKIYFGSHDKNFYCLDVSLGNKIWSTSLDAEVWCSPAIANGQVIVGAGTQKVFCFASDSTPPPPGCLDCKDFGPCDDCNKYMKFTVGSRNWSICDVPQSPSMDAAPVIRNGRIFILIRYVCNTIGAQLEWDAQTKTVKITRTDGKTIALTIGKGQALVDGSAIYIDDENKKPNKSNLVSPFIENGRTLVPLRFVAENIIVSSCTKEVISWDSTNKIAKICFKDPKCIDDGLKFSLQDTDGIIKTEQNYRGKVTLLDFSASWCQPCKASMTTLKQLKSIFGQDINIVTIDAFESYDKVVMFKEDEGANWDFLLDPNKSFVNKLGINSIPTFILLDKKGKICFRRTGGDTDLFNIIYREIIKIAY